MNKKVQKIVTSLLLVTTIAVVTTQAAFGVQNLKSCYRDVNLFSGVSGNERNQTYVFTPNDARILNESWTQVGQGWNYITYQVYYTYYSPSTGGAY